MPDDFVLSAISLGIRPWEIADSSRLIEVSATSPDLSPQFGGLDLATIDSAQKFIEQNLIFTDSAKNWAITFDNKIIGNVGLSNIEFRHGTAWTYYWLSKEFRGHGIACNALMEISTIGFELGLHRLELGHRLNNPPSCAVATRAGFIAEGIEREKLRYGDARFDVEIHARLATDPKPNQTLFLNTYKSGDERI